MKNRKLLMIPGPIEFTPDVLRAMGMPTTSHVAQNFIEVFGQVLEDLRKVFLAPSGQPFVVPGSGTLAMDMAAANLVEPGGRQPKKLEVSLRLLSPLGSIRTNPGGVSRPHDSVPVEPGSKQSTVIRNVAGWAGRAVSSAGRHGV